MGAESEQNCIFRPFPSAVTDKQWYHNGQTCWLLFMLFDMKRPYLDHIFKQLKMDILIVIAFVLKQHIYRSGTSIPEAQ